VVVPTIAACTPAAHSGSLPPTLALEDHGGASIAMQNGIPVPTFDAQAARGTISLNGPWRVERRNLDTDLSLTDRGTSLPLIEEEAAGRQAVTYDDADWESIQVPGSLNPPPRDTPENGAWYRKRFYVPTSWTGLAATLKAEAINYLADVWVNGTHAGYHEGGYTPFAFDLSPLLVPGSWNVIAIRVDNPQWGTRNDIVPWGLTDWWNYGGITRPIRIEATPAMHVVRADVTPHLDGIDVSVVVRNAASVVGLADGGATSPPASAPTSEVPAASAPPGVQIDVLPAQVTPLNVGDPSAAALVVDGAPPVASQLLPLDPLAPGDIRRLDTAFLMGEPDLWTPGHPALYVLRVTARAEDASTDVIVTSFGLRHIAVADDSPRLMLNGAPVMFSGVGLHDERIGAGQAAPDVPPHRITDVNEVMEQLNHARAVDADLIRSGHAPANPLLLTLADRMGFAVWEEIPLYHYTPLTYEIAMDRGIPQQMLREMALRDMNRPSVLFHGLSNESTGTDEREAALRELHDIDREIDGTRLTGQAAFGLMPTDPTQAPLDVSGFTFYYGVFYGSHPTADTRRALSAAHDTFPDKPIMALEFGRWVDTAWGVRQQRIFRQTYPAFAARSGELSDGFVGAAVWWTLEDFTTMSPGIALERFGLFRPNGQGRPAAEAAAELFAASAGGGAAQQIESDVGRADPVASAPGNELRLLGYVAYALLISLGSMTGVLLLLVRRGGRASAAQSRGQP
jgi:beta-galactosidase